MCLGHLGEKVVETLGDGAEFGLEVVYSFDGAELRGTAGALRQALPLLGPAFFVLYGDSYLECGYASIQEAFQSAGKLALMTVFRNEGQWDRSNIEFSGGRILAYDKVTQTAAMQYIDYGLGVLDARALESVPDNGRFDLATVYQEMLERGELAGLEVTERFYEIGSVAGLEETRRHLKSHGLDQRGRTAQEEM
jgi:N-acetyl-alpha-D-muramate 1-phosphate uridylyltransferase